MKTNNVIYRHWETWSKITNERQSEYFKRKIEAGHTIKCVSIGDVFTEDEIDKIKRYCMVEKKQCFKNAFRLTLLFPNRVKYVEGEVTILNGGLGIEHAWNLVDGEHYVDLTFELALNEDVTKETYVALGEYDVDVIRGIACETMVYGGVYDHLFLKEFSKKNLRINKKH